MNWDKIKNAYVRLTLGFGVECSIRYYEEHRHFTIEIPTPLKKGKKNAVDIVIKDAGLTTLRHPAYPSRAGKLVLQ